MFNETQYDREVAQLEEDLANGDITQAQFKQYMRGLNEDIRAGAEEAAQGAYDDYMGQ